jgi:hypothetical protein
MPPKTPILIAHKVVSILLKSNGLRTGLVEVGLAIWIQSWESYNEYMLSPSSLIDRHCTDI